MSSAADHEEPPFDAEPEPWRPPVPCPRCGQTQTRFVGMQEEASIYECTLCDIEFEAEE